LARVITISIKITDFLFPAPGGVFNPAGDKLIQNKGNPIINYPFI
jgi:hypothetical protein